MYYMTLWHLTYGHAVREGRGRVVGVSLRVGWSFMEVDGIINLNGDEQALQGEGNHNP